MARPSKLSLDDIQDAVSVLREQGKPLNPYQIKKVIGYGSEAKIDWFMKALDIEAEYEDEDPLVKRLTKLIHPVALEMKQDQVGAIAEAKEKFEEQISNERETIRKLQTDLNKSNNKLIEVNGQYEKLCGDLEEKDKKLHEALERINEMDVFIAQLTTELKGTKSAKDKLEDDISVIKTNLEEEKRNYESGMSQLKAEHNQAVEQFKVEIEGWKNDFKQSAYNEEAAKIELGKVSTTLENKVEELANAHGKIHKLETRSVELDQALSSKETDITNLSTKVSELTNKGLELQERLETSFDQIKSLSEKEREYESAMSDVKSKHQLSEQREHLLKNQVDSLEKIVERLTEQKNDDKH